MDKIRKGDDVVVLTGKDKGKRGTVQSRVNETHVLVEGINLAKKHQKPNPNKGLVGGVVDRTMPIDISNIALVNPATGKGDRVGFKTLADGKKIRVFKSNGDQVA